MDEDNSIALTAWEGALTCPCGRPYILLKVEEAYLTKDRELQPLAVYVRCPVHRRVRRLLLPYSRMSEWIGAVADRLFRCNICGAPAQPRRVAIKGHWTVILLECPSHGVRDNKRALWSPIYTAAKAIWEIKLAEKLPMGELLGEEEPVLPSVCHRCGTENDPDARFCAYCGERLEI